MSDYTASNSNVMNAGAPTGIPSTSATNIANIAHLPGQLNSPTPVRTPFIVSRQKPILGVCAMDNKARSKPMRNILDRIMAYGDFEVVIFGDKVILDEEISTWPKCDFLISFFSSQFPMQKVIDFIKLRKPFCINDLPMQQLLWDRRIVLCMLDAIDVPTPQRLFVNRDGGPWIPRDVVDKVNKNLGIDLMAIDFSEERLVQLDDDTLMVGKKKIVKPFVEKPVNGEDHNIYIYYPKRMGGGVRRLFRKVGNKSSEYISGVSQVRMDGGSYIYEEFLDVDNSEDIKVYTIGPYYAHAETRKSPVVDGIVRRNVDGKEVRYVTTLNEEDADIARRVCMAFGQAICGFDLLRVAGKSYVIDVNGWSFVKGNDNYYDMCSKILRDTFLKVARRRKHSISVTDAANAPRERQQWKLKSYISVFRHADRTPKQKLKFSFSSAPFLGLYTPGTEESMFRSKEALALVLDAADRASALQLEDPNRLLQLREILNKKSKHPGTKVQVKPIFTDQATKQNLKQVQLIVKWGGEFTHAGRHHSQDLGDNLRKDLLIMNRKILDDVKIYTSSERRVMATADTFAKALFKVAELHQEYLIVNKVMLDDNFKAKETLEKVKAKLLAILSGKATINTTATMTTTTENDDQGSVVSYKISSFVPIPPEVKSNPPALLESLVSLLKGTRKTLRANYESLDLDAIQPRWCCAESPILFKERWEKLFQEFCLHSPDDESTTAKDPLSFTGTPTATTTATTTTSFTFDPSKISELYDSLKYDALHHREFLERLFVSDPHDLSCKEKLRALFRTSKILFDFTAPQEFGLDSGEKLGIGLTIAESLLLQIVSDLEEARRSGSDPSTRLYFTKESHVHAILNVVLHSGLSANNDNAIVEELDYLTQITFEVYEREKNSSSLSTLSPGIPNSLSVEGNNSNGNSNGNGGNNNGTFSPLLSTSNSASNLSPQSATGLQGTISTTTSPFLTSPNNTTTTTTAAFEYSLRIGLSPGAHDSNILDVQIDNKHALSVAPRKWITDYIELDEAIAIFKRVLASAI